MEKKLISVIVPIYKVEKYLDKCIKSILNQTYKNIEVLLIDDGSPDNCPKICDEWAKKENKIKVYHKKNGGLSDARNYGIERANGELLLFIDSDDYIENDMIETLYNDLVNNKADISVCGIKLYFEDKNNFKFYEDNSCETVLLNTETALRTMINEHSSFKVNAWNKLYKKELFKTVRYPVGKVYEDVGTTYKLVLQAKKVAYNPEPKYIYVQRAFSITKDLKYDERGLMRIEMANEMYNTVVNKYSSLKNEYSLYLISQYTTLVNCMVASGVRDKNFIKKTKKLILNNLKNIIFSKEIFKKRKFQYIALLISFSFYKQLYKKRLKSE